MPSKPWHPNKEQCTISLLVDVTQYSRECFLVLCVHCQRVLYSSFAQRFPHKLHDMRTQMLGTSKPNDRVILFLFPRPFSLYSSGVFLLVVFLSETIARKRVPKTK